MIEIVRSNYSNTLSHSSKKNALFNFSIEEWQQITKNIEVFIKYYKILEAK